MLDDKDMKILECLKENSRDSTQKISKKTFIPITTVHNRLKKLETEGIIKKYTIELDRRKLGKMLSAIILAQIDHGVLKKENISENSLIESISEKEVVDETFLVAGESDLVIKISVETVEKLNDFLVNDLRNISGIQRTDTMIILNER